MLETGHLIMCRLDQEPSDSNPGLGNVKVPVLRRTKAYLSHLQSLHDTVTVEKRVSIILIIDTHQLNPFQPEILQNENPTSLVPFRYLCPTYLILPTDDFVTSLLPLLKIIAALFTFKSDLFQVTQARVGRSTYLIRNYLALLIRSQARAGKKFRSID